MKLLQSAHQAMAMSVILLTVVGCGGTGDQPELGQVQGTITFDGKPLSGVAVVFQPDSGRPARGFTDADGKYELTYIRDTRGTKVGKNRVEVAPSEEADDDAEALLGDDSLETKKPVSSSGRPTIPARYNTASELEADVKPGENKFDFELKS